LTAIWSLHQPLAVMWGVAFQHSQLALPCVLVHVGADMDLLSVTQGHEQCIVRHHAPASWSVSLQCASSSQTRAPPFATMAPTLPGPCNNLLHSAAGTRSDCYQLIPVIVGPSTAGARVPRSAEPALRVLQFRSLSDQLYRSPMYWREVRLAVLEQLQAHPDWYKGYVPGDYGQYCASMALPGTWGDHVTLQVRPARKTPPTLFLL
jgi:hypothetical protein